MIGAATESAEVRVVEHFVEVLGDRLADRSGGRHEPGWNPRQNVVVGVLEPRFVQPVRPPKKGQDPDVGEQQEDQQAKPIEALPQGEPASLGLDFIVEGASEEVQIEIDARFAVYIEEYPSLDEELRHLGKSAAGPVPAAGAETANALAQPASGGQEAEPSQDEAAGPPSVESKTRKKQVSLVSIWRRIDVVVPRVSISVAIDGSEATESVVLNEAVQIAVQQAFESPQAARKFTSRTRQVDPSALGSQSDFDAALRASEDHTWQPDCPDLALTAFADPIAEGRHRVSVSLSNMTVLHIKPFQNLAIYDCSLQVRSTSAAIVAQRFYLAPDDYRYQGVSDVYGHGRGCVATYNAAERALASDCLPTFRQPVIHPRSDHVPGLEWTELAQNPQSILDGVEVAMRSYLDDWQKFLRSASPAVARASQVERDQFQGELNRFRLGQRAMREDSKLALAFRLANRVMAEANAGKYTSWRLFQLVFLVTHLPALAAREHPDVTDFLSELDYADVLWFPTGGGKTEAYLGLMVTALFYDRLRGKDHGMTAWLKFPLRMLSVQQLLRVLKVLVVAERIRVEDLRGVGDPFELGYLVGGSNTPNSLIYADGWWHGITEAAREFAKDPDTFKRRRLVNNCPYCGAMDRVRLVPDAKRVRLVHMCQECTRELPLLASDDEIYRYAPSVVVGTVDKLTGFAHFGEFTQFSHGPRFRCPDHGWFTFPRNGKCLVGDLCKQPQAHWITEPTWHDPVPSLIIQDELHLVREELGAFDAHYEGLLAEIQRGSPSKLPSKILAASATIEQYEDQIRQVYGRRPRSFPAPGFRREESFYATTTEDVRRVFLGVLPHYRRKADVAAIVQMELLRTITNLQDNLSDAAKSLNLTALPAEELQNLLFDYEVSLAYVNNKSHGHLIHDEIERLSASLATSGSDAITSRVLTGEVNVPELAEAIDHVTEDKLSTPRAERLRALIGTAVVSHGVDLERLNVLVMAGLPSTVADYIQATSRAGRVHTGLVVTVFDTFQRRERSAFVNFQSFHRFLDRMVEPVPVNKYAYFAVQRTLPGMAMALLWDLCRDPEFHGPEVGIRYTRYFLKWWNERKPQLNPVLTARIERAYRSAVLGVNERGLEDELVARAGDRWSNHEVTQLGVPTADRTVELFTRRPLLSFRDVDVAVFFEPMPMSRSAVEALEGQGSE
jgi:hypothetical protein